MISMSPATTPDRILRLALLACALDPRSDLTREQRDTIVQCGRQERGVPRAVIRRLHAPLLAWCQDYRPRIARMVEEALAALAMRKD